MEPSIPNHDPTVDFQRNPPYERRLVLFYDILGWREELARVGTDAEKIGNLRRLLLYNSRFKSLPKRAFSSITTFSDNVVCSIAAHTENVAPFFVQAGFIQLFITAMGFLVRGGITVGDILHDDEVVFGPALNRAHELESKIAVYPRFIVDDEVLKIKGAASFCLADEGVHFMDPFNSVFIRHWWMGQRQDQDLLSSAAGFPSGPVPDDGLEYLALDQFLKDMRWRISSPLPDNEWAKVAWLYDRIATQRGRPLSSSYPRIRPEDAR